MVPPLKAAANAKRHVAAIEVLEKQYLGSNSWEALRIGVSAIRFDHQWEDIDVEA
jgi:hypothetical protein